MCILGKPASSFTPEEERNLQNQTIKLDPTITQQRLHANDVEDEDKTPDGNHLDEDNAIMGIDENPPLGSLNDTMGNSTSTCFEYNSDKNIFVQSKSLFVTPSSVHIIQK